MENMDINRFASFVNQNKWIFAKTYAERAPHEYIVKDYLDANEKTTFKDAVIFVRENGFPAFFGGYEHIYLYYDNHYYWTMGDPVDETIILNRCDYRNYEMTYNKGAKYVNSSESN